MGRSWMVLATVLTFAACGGDSGTNPDPGDGGDGGGPGGGGSARSVKADPSFGSDIQEIFERKGCTNSSCHGSAEMGGLLLTAGNSHAELVNVPATTETGTRVIPGDAQNSYLVIKLEGRQTVGTQMPQTGTPLDSIDLANVRNWITQGANNN